VPARGGTSQTNRPRGPHSTTRSSPPAPGGPRRPAGGSHAGCGGTRHPRRETGDVDGEVAHPRPRVRVAQERGGDPSGPHQAAGLRDVAANRRARGDVLEHGRGESTESKLESGSRASTSTSARTRHGGPPAGCVDTRPAQSGRCPGRRPTGRARPASSSGVRRRSRCPALVSLGATGLTGRRPGWRWRAIPRRQCTTRGRVATATMLPEGPRALSPLLARPRRSARGGGSRDRR
jgi:hypothetical protein